MRQFSMQNLPGHVALIPDGNRRWAKEHGLPTLEGHRRGFDRVFKMSEQLRKLGVQTFTIWAFSTENWQRTKEEVGYLMRIYATWIDMHLKTALRDQIHYVHLGRRDRLPSYLLKAIENAEQKTGHFTKYYQAVAVDYGGRDEIVRAIKKVQSSKFKVQDLTEENFGKFLDTNILPQPNPDLVIRTSGEQRSSGFLTWQAAYSEYIFHKKYLPDFTDQDVLKCLKEYSRRKRRFGK